MKRKRTSEFEHYPGCKRRDPANCSGCALTNLEQDEPNYTAWPLAYMVNDRTIPAKWKAAFTAQLKHENRLYALNVKKHVREFGARFSDGTEASVIDDEGGAFHVEIRGRYGL